jgi:hypothetical protein
LGVFARACAVGDVLGFAAATGAHDDGTGARRGPAGARFAKPMISPTARTPRTNTDKMMAAIAASRLRRVGSAGAGGSVRDAYRGAGTGGTSGTADPAGRQSPIAAVSEVTGPAANALFAGALLG